MSGAQERTIAQQDITGESTSKMVQVSGGKVRYHEMGNGKPIVLLHGSGA